MRPFLLIVLAAPALAQSLHFGIRAGVPLTVYYDTGRGGNVRYEGAYDYSAATRRYTFGPSIEYRNARGWGFEADALFKRQGYVIIREFVNYASGATSRTAYDVKGDSWDVPVLFKYRFARWHLAAGPALRYVGPVRGIGEATLTDPFLGTTRTPIDTTDPPELSKRWYAGLTGAAGLQFVRGRLHLEPELRYTRWAQNISQPGLRFASNQVEFLLGLLF